MLWLNKPNGSGRGQVRHHVWWTSHRDGCTEISRKATMYKTMAGPMLLTSACRAESLLSASSITRTRQAHQITASSIYILMKEAYQDYCSESKESGRSTLTFEDLCDRRKSTVPVLASGVGYGARHIHIDPLVQRMRLQTVPRSTLPTAPLLLRQQQCELCPLASSSLQRHDVN